jgi:hypothetical protein
MLLTTVVMAALFHAVEDSHEQIVSFLLQNRADVHRRIM